jgi:UvrD/REP helicase N-terminal domain
MFMGDVGLVECCDKPSRLWANKIIPLMFLRYCARFAALLAACIIASLGMVADHVSLYRSELSARAVYSSQCLRPLGTTMAWDDNLDPQSPAYRIAADASQYVRVLAGPGTGKSFALKRRVARLLESNVLPARILPVTFTKVAAEDLHRELINMGVPGCEDMRGSTLHALGMRILRRQNVLAVTGRNARPLNRFEMEPLLYDLSAEFGNKRQREQRIRAYEAAWARLQHEEPGFAQADIDLRFQQSLLSWLRFHEGMLIGEWCAAIRVRDQRQSG